MSARDKCYEANKARQGDQEQLRIWGGEEVYGGHRKGLSEMSFKQRLQGNKL